MTRPIALATVLGLALAQATGLPAGPALAQPTGSIGPSAAPAPVPGTGAIAPPAEAAPGPVALRAQANIPLGVTVVARSILRGEDAVVLTVVVSFDSQQTNSVNMAGGPTFLRFGEDQRLSLRRPAENRDLRIRTGQSMEGALVFPGFLPPEAREVTLVFNENSPADDLVAPGISLRIPLPAAP